MSVASAIFNRGNLKLLVALAIPGLIGWAFVYSQKAADIEVAAVRKAQKENPITDRVVLDNYSLKEVTDSNQIRWQLVAKQGTVQPSGHEVMLKDVTVEYFDGDKLKMRLNSPVGEAVESTKYVKLESANGRRVVAEGEEGKARLEAEKVELKEKNKFLATGGVTIVWPEVAKVTGNYATGTIDVNNLNNFKIVGNTHAVITVH